MLEKVSITADACINTLTNSTSIYSVEVRDGEGKVNFFRLRATKKSDARIEAANIASAIAKASGSTLLWRMAHDKTWNVASELVKDVHLRKESKLSKIKKALDQFFFIGDEESGEIK